MDKSLLAEMLSGRVTIACIGNEMRGDDGIGPFIAGLITPSERIKVVNCGETPENFLGVIAGTSPEKVVIVDSAHFRGEPGEIRMIDKDSIEGGGFSTHDAILTLFANYIEEQTGARTYFLAIQPKRSEVGEGLSPEIEKVAREIAGAINNLTGESK
jgi:hydrogenase 3 maturation protease